MKKYILILLNALVVFHANTFAQNFNFKNIDINNINAKIGPASDIFWDFSSPGFEVPKGSGLHSIFTGGLWIGGMDNSGIIHLAAQTYRQTG